MEKTKKQYLYNFISGGWNSEFATTKRKAIAQAKKRWNDSKGLDVDVNSFRISTPNDYNACMSLFY